MCGWSRKEVSELSGKERILEIADVVPGGPAAEAGLKVGDTITAIDGEPTTDMSLPATRGKLRTEPPGTRLRLTVRSGSSTHDAVLTLRDLV